MKMNWFAGAALAAIVPAQAIAQERAPGDAAKVWTLTATGSRTFSTDDAIQGADSTGVGLALERAFDRFRIGIAGGVSWRDDDPTVLAVTFPDTSSYSLGGWAGADLGAASLSFFVDYASETLEGGELSLPGGGSAQLASDSDFLNVGVSITQLFGDRTRIAPTASLAWTHAEDRFRAGGPFNMQPATTREDDGVVGSLGAVLAHDASSRVTLFASGAAVGSDNANAVFGLTSTRAGRFYGPQRLSEDEGDVWGEFAAGVVLNLGAASVAFEADATAGLAGDYVLALVSTSVSF